MNTSINSGTMQTQSNGLFKFAVYQPNSYYTCGGKHMVPPSVKFAVDFGNGNEKVYHVPLNDGYRGRSLTNLPNKPNRSTGR